MPKKSRTTVDREYLVALELVVDAARILLDDPPLPEEEQHDSSARLYRKSAHRLRLQGALLSVEDTRGSRIPATYANTEETD